MQLFYLNPSASVNDKMIHLDEEESKHCVKVLRLKEGDILHFTDGKGALIKGHIVEPLSKTCIIKIDEVKTFPEKSPKIHIAVSPTKQADRFEWFLEKATETGVSEITPLICKRSERSKMNMDRLNKIAISAMKQSLQYHLPKINPPLDLDKFLNALSSGNKTERYIAHCLEEKSNTLKGVYKKGNDAIVLIGPEGDFTKEEIELSTKRLFMPVSLGENRLRTETAALAACYTISLMNSN